MAASSSSTVPPQHQVFINFRGKDLRRGFVSHLVDALKRNKINVFMDDFEDRGKPLESLLTRIEGSKVALAIFSENYTDSNWCLKEAEKMHECMKEDKLVVIPVFYKVEPSTVRGLKGDFGDKLWILAKGDEKRKKQCDEALKSIPNLFGITVDDTSDECQTINDIVKAVKTVLLKISVIRRENVNDDPSLSETRDAGTVSGGEEHGTFGMDKRLRELGDKLDCVKYQGTRIIGVVGMPGIGKTTLMKELFKKWERKFTRQALVDKIRVQSKELLSALLLEELLGLEDPHTEDPYETYKRTLLGRKVLVFLDDVSNREQIDALLGKRDWIREGSRIVIATSDASLTNGLVDDTYVVQNLDHRDSLQLFLYHANPPNEDFTKLSEEVVHYARGHPLALKMLGVALYKKNINQWKAKLKTLSQSLIPSIGSVFEMSYDELLSEQKVAFLDIACFRSESVEYVESLLSSNDAESSDTIKALNNKFLINTCDGRVEMHDLLFTFSRELDPKASTQDGNTQQRRLWLHKDIIKGGIINVLQNKIKPANVRGIFLDLSEVKEETTLDCDHFLRMCNLRYLKFYNSHCPHECETKNKINIPDGLKLPLKEIRCLHWLKFPLEELNDFNPINLVDLKLPYSDIQRLWEGDDKDTPSLKWVDLSHSSKLSSLSELSKAENLQRLNLEGCTALKLLLPSDMKNMKRLAFLNLKGCISLEYLPEMNLVSLKTLTLSGCSNFKEFPLVSENIEILYLDGTAISQLPSNMEKLQRLVVLNMKNCQKLEKIPDRVGELKALQELILSDCSNLKYFPEINMISLNILLLDGTAIEVMPRLPSVQYLCLSRSKISCLPAGICKLFHLKWLDLKYCTSLTSVPEFPPNLQCLDAHGCSSLKTVSKPLARIMPTEQNPSTFIFTNCDNLEQASREEITSYAQRKCQLLAYARTRYNGGLVSEALFSTCFPGCEVPSWFCYETVGSELEVKLLPHWHDKRLAGIALCAVVSLGDCHDQISRLSVTCTFKVKVEDKSWVPFSCPVGSWTRDGDKIETEHVFIGYTSCPYAKKCPEDENSDKCNSTEASLEFTVAGGTNEKGKFKVLKCGLGLVYAKDKGKNSSHEAKYDMPVEVSFQETSKEVDGGAKKRKKTRGDDGRTKKKKKSRKDDNSPCQSNNDASVTPRGKNNSVQAHG